MPARVLDPADFTAMPWRNGKGTTLELAREDGVDGAMLWRLSSADVVEAGAFSPFPGVDRILMLTEGDGFDLDFGPHGRVAPVEPLEPVHFSGDWTTRADNVRGPSRDLNVMVARGQATAVVGVHRDAIRTTGLADCSMMLALAGTFIVTLGSQEFTLAQSHLLLVRGEKGRRATTSGSGLLVQIDIDVQ